MTTKSKKCAAEGCKTLHPYAVERNDGRLWTCPNHTSPEELRRRENRRVADVRDRYGLERQLNGWWRATKVTHGFRGENWDVITLPTRAQVVARARLCWRHFRHPEQTETFDLIFTDEEDQPTNAPETSVRARKVAKILRVLDTFPDITADSLRHLDADGWRAAAELAGVRSPSQITINAIVAIYEERT